MSIALIDGDSLIYKSGFSFEFATVWNKLEIELGVETEEVKTLSSDIYLSKKAIDAAIDNILFKTGCDDYEIWLSGSNNFRYTVMDTYKHNRTTSNKPMCFDELKQHLLTHHKAKVVDGFEADDIVVYLKTTYPLKYTLCAIDKDVLYQTEGNHYNYGKDEFVTVSYDDTIRFFWYQVLVGDNVDGYGGCKGIGKVKAQFILDSALQYALDNKLDINQTYCYVVYQTYLDNNHNYDDFIATCRVASMKQVRYENNEFILSLIECSPEPMATGLQAP